MKLITTQGLTQWITAVLCILFVGCANTDKLTLFNYGIDPNSTSAKPMDRMTPPDVSDGLAINWANSMQVIMRCNSTGSRIAREVSSTAQVGLAAFSGIGAAFNYGATTLAALGMSSAGVPELQKIFNAKSRAEVYNQAANMIQDGVLEYYEHDTAPSKKNFTPNGLTLVKKVSAAITLVDNALTGQLPSVKQMKQAVEEMTPAGTQKQDPSAAPVNVSVPTALLRPPRPPETVTKEQMRKLQDDMARLKANKPLIIDFVQELRLYDRTATTNQKLLGYPQIVKDAGLSDKIIPPDKNTINTYYQENATSQEMENLKTALDKQFKSLKPQPALPE
jgi:hypothetical protein